MRKSITGMIAGNNDPAEFDDPIRDDLCDMATECEDLIIQDRYLQCASCEFLSKDFKLLGKTVKERVASCTVCGCNLNLKIKLSMFHCPEGRW